MLITLRSNFAVNMLITGLLLIDILCTATLHAACAFDIFINISTAPTTITAILLLYVLNNNNITVFY